MPENQVSETPEKAEVTTQPFVGKKKIMRLGGSLVIVLPKSFIESNKLDEDSEIGMVANKDLLITTDEAIVEKLNKELHEHTHKMIRECFEAESDDIKKEQRLKDKK